MEYMDYISPFINKINIVIGIFVALMTYYLGNHWWLFLAFLLLNVGDWVSRWIAARITGTENSKKAATGIVKKMGYWLMILLSFGMSAVFIEIGEIMGIDLGITSLLGWFVLASLFVNELRSILENLVDAGYQIPTVLTKGLEIANKAIDGAIHLGDHDKEDGNYDISLSAEKVEALRSGKKKRVVLEIGDRNT